jgi:hypothetical protein
LLFIWIWLPVAILGAMLATPADIFTIVLAMAFALPCYLLGVTWASDVAGTPRWIVTIACLLIAGALAVATWFPLVPYFVAAGIIFAVLNVALGVKSCRDVAHSRKHIFSGIGIAYGIGLLFGPLGVVILTVPAVLIANRKPAPSIGEIE